jgi:hypothetical protein
MPTAVSLVTSRGGLASLPVSTRIDTNICPKSVC